ncbi:carboxypeptidase-like regulatory domain-containing protein [Roseivirga sp. BDSF3-8]|uniref:carboxypeptidase-like regulatory domain-containing protein n=1 Tax=Roseivirga sp. BDSF3-8 TaxID=3241598 RepID=UPI003531CC4D
MVASQAHAQDNGDEQQEKKKVIQFSGVVIDAVTEEPLPGVHVYVPLAGRGTTSSSFGYFSMPVLEGDSVVISSVGFRKRGLIIPATEKDTYSVMIELSEDTTMLPTVEVLPYPTEELFKEAVLAMELPDEGNYDNLAENLNEELMASMFRSTPMDGELNYRVYQQQQIQYMNDRFGPRPNPLLNPFNWARFIKSLKKEK